MKIIKFDNCAFVASYIMSWEKLETGGVRIHLQHGKFADADVDFEQFSAAMEKHFDQAGGN